MVQLFSLGHLDTMRLLRTIVLVAFVVFSTYFLFGYARSIYMLNQMDESESGHSIGEVIELLRKPHICAWRPWSPSSKASGGISLFLWYDTPEGTMPIFYFPSWPFALAAGGVLIYGGVVLYGHRHKPVA